MRSRRRKDPYERAAARIDAARGPFEPLPPAPFRLSRKRLAFYLVLGAVGVAVLRDGLGRGAPPVDGSCTRPAFSVDREEVRQDAAVKWSVRGPTGSRVVFAADTNTVPTTGQLAGPVTLVDCKASGRFGVSLPDGDHTLRAFLVHPDGTVTDLGTRPLVVNAPH